MNIYLNYNMPKVIQQRSTRVDGVKQVLAQRTEGFESRQKDSAKESRQKGFDAIELRSRRNYTSFQDSNYRYMPSRVYKLEISFGAKNITLDIPPQVVRKIVAKSKEQQLGRILDNRI